MSSLQETVLPTETNQTEFLWMQACSLSRSAFSLGRCCKGWGKYKGFLYFLSWSSEQVWLTRINEQTDAIKMYQIHPLYKTRKASQHTVYICIPYYSTLITFKPTSGLEYHHASAKSRGGEEMLAKFQDPVLELCQELERRGTCVQTSPGHLPTGKACKKNLSTKRLGKNRYAVDAGKKEKFTVTDW